MTQTCTIAIVTKNNPIKLQRCLQSVAAQTIKPASIIVVDNDNDTSALVAVNEFQKKPIPLAYLHAPHITVPEARNKAVAACDTSIIGFTDDDCVLDPSWTREVITSLKKTPASFVIGQTMLFNPNNLTAQAFQIRYAYWLAYELKKHDGAPSPFLMDTKNVAYRKNVFTKIGVTFDAAMQVSGHDSADTDIGFQLQSKKVCGVFNPRMIVRHEETPTTHLLTKKAYARGALAKQLSQKWSLKGEFVYPPDFQFLYFLRRTNYWWSQFHPVMNSARLNLWEKIVVFFLIRLHDFIYLRGFIDIRRV